MILTQQQLDKIHDFIQMEMLKRGYSAKIISFKEVEGKLESRIEFQTEDFQTAPVMFKRLYISNFSSSIQKHVEFSEEYNIDCYQVWIQVSVRYENFSGGSNGTNLFSVTGTVVKDEDPNHYSRNCVEDLKLC